MKAEIKINSKGVGQVLRSDSMRKAAKKRADRVAAAAGPGYKSTSTIGRNRARASVITDSAEAAVKDSRTGNLLRSAGAGRRG